MWLGLDIWTSCHWGVAVCGWDWTYGLAAIGGLLYVVGIGHMD